MSNDKTCQEKVTSIVSKTLFNAKGCFLEYEDVFDLYYSNLDIDAGEYTGTDPNFWQYFLDGGAPNGYPVYRMINHIASYTLIVKEYFNNYYFDIAVRSSWKDYLPLSYLSEYVKDINNEDYFIGTDADIPIFCLCHTQQGRRNIDQADFLKGVLAKAGTPLDAALEFKLENAEIIARLSGRRVCRGCGENSHIIFNPSKVTGVCDACGGELYHRKDDDAEVIAHRLDVYAEQTEPIIDYYRSAGLLRTISAIGEVSDIAARAIAALK